MTYGNLEELGNKIFSCFTDHTEITTPLKINIEHNHGGLIILLSKLVIYRFHVNLPGCMNFGLESFKL